ncbi:unnamed protein product [Rhizoctonia solani]|uniref:DUF6535 domain-containing protein n=1 Tax=Rhizoctonia solani TaxID=456999 RepID=A0A8H3BAT1_9AGAM|nr:unnamed protein product [Rhizoctonia solani]
MSLMLPGNLSGGGSIPRTMSSGDSTTPYNKDLDHAKIDDALAPGMIAVPQPGEASQMDGQLQDTSGPETIAAKMLRKNGPPDHFDEEGAELGKEARFWKVYVEESDRCDAEVIDSWNKSLDVILVFVIYNHSFGFARLLTIPRLYRLRFSLPSRLRKLDKHALNGLSSLTIGSRFLIETSKKLQPDPADTSAQSLLLITQTLLAMANNIPPPGLDVLSPNGTDTFTPTRNAIVINTLWYLSLSISLATAFIAALAKEWCQSFLAGRTGHPCIQARRRQQKWSMIETWRMEELITLLPTLIHVSLLFFSVGLCFYVQELNAAVAIPVVCVTGVAVGFYACSSLAASFIEFFPYKTIVSKMFGSTIRSLERPKDYLFNHFKIVKQR